MSFSRRSYRAALSLLAVMVIFSLSLVPVGSVRAQQIGNGANAVPFTDKCKLTGTQPQSCTFPLVSSFVGGAFADAFWCVASNAVPTNTSAFFTPNSTAGSIETGWVDTTSTYWPVGLESFPGNENSLTGVGPYNLFKQSVGNAGVPWVLSIDFAGNQGVRIPPGWSIQIRSYTSVTSYADYCYLSGWYSKL